MRNTKENEKKEKEEIPCEGFLNLKKNVYYCDQNKWSIIFYL